MNPSPFGDILGRDGDFYAVFNDKLSGLYIPQSDFVSIGYLLQGLYVFSLRSDVPGDAHASRRDIP